jgi:hypothetical protein
MTAALRTLIQQQQVARRAPRATPVMLKLLQVWQFNATAEGGLAGAIATAKQYGFTGLVVKALDGIDWMSVYDTSPDALDSVTKVAQQWRMCADAGLRYFCWTNPKHDIDMTGEAALTARIARACDGVLLDTEPYRLFWGSNAPAGLAQSFMESIREQAPDAFIGLQPDPRPAALDQIRVQEWLPFVDVLCGQHYYQDFNSDPAAEMAYALELGQRFGLPVLPTLPGNAPTASLPLSEIWKFPGFVVWRLGTTPPQALQLLGSCAVLGLSSPRLVA